MKPITVLALIALVWINTPSGLPDLSGLRDRVEAILGGGGGVVPDPEVEAPSESLQALAKPITEKLRTDRPKAKRVAGIFRGYAMAMDGSIGQRIETVGQLNEVWRSATQAMDVAGGPAIAAEITAALVQHVGLDRDDDGLFVDRRLDGDDREKIAESFRAVSWAALQAAGG